MYLTIDPEVIRSELGVPGWGPLITDLHGLFVATRWDIFLEWLSEAQWEQIREGTLHVAYLSCIGFVVVPGTFSGAVVDVPGLLRNQQSSTPLDRRQFLSEEVIDSLRRRVRDLTLPEASSLYDVIWSPIPDEICAGKVWEEYEWWYFVAREGGLQIFQPQVLVPPSEFDTMVDPYDMGDCLLEVTERIGGYNAPNVGTKRASQPRLLTNLPKGFFF